MVELQVRDESLIVRYERGIAIKQLSLPAGLARHELARVLVQVLPLEDVQVRCCQPRRNIPADPTCVAGGAGVDRDLVRSMYFFARSATEKLLDRAAQLLVGDVQVRRCH